MVVSRMEAEEAILFAYTAAIASISRPTDKTNTTTYRSKENLLSLLNEMEHDYTEDSSRTICPNSYTLSAVLLGIDDVQESLDVLEQFEEKYNSKHHTNSEEHNIVTIQAYNVVIACCSKSSNGDKSGWQLALSILQRIRRHGPQPNEQTFGMVIQACADNSQMKIALSLLDEIRQLGNITPTLKLYIPLLKVCARSGDSKTATSFITIIKDDGLELTTEIMNIYLSSLAKGKEHMRALGILQDMISNPTTPPDIYSFNTVISGCAKNGDYDAAYALLEEMREGMFVFPQEGKMVEIKPDVVTYNSLLSCAEPEECISLIQEMRLTRRNREGVIRANSISYVNAITRCRKATLEDGDSDAYDIAMYLLEIAREDKVDLNVYVYSAAIWSAEAVNDYNTAVQLLREMTCTPNSVCYDGVISVLSRQGLHREALYLYYEMQKNGLCATWKTYQRLVFAINNSRDRELSKSCRRKAALLEGVLSAMPLDDRKVIIGGSIFVSLVRNYGNTTIDINSYQAARKVFDSIEGPVDDATLSAMLRVCSETNRASEALLLLHSSDVVSDIPGLVSGRSLSYAVIACSKADRWYDALTLMDLYGCTSNLRESNSTPIELVSIKAINSVIGACGRSQRADMSVTILNDMSSKYGVKQNELSYRLAIIACNQAEHRERRNSDSASGYDLLELKWWECALSLLRRMREDGITPSLQSFSSCISACEASGEWQRAIGVLQQMPSFSSILSGDEVQIDSIRDSLSNLYCLNAAISACEKGGAWVEALQLYEDIRLTVKPNFITINALIIALDKANQRDLAESIYKDSLRDKVVSPWKKRYDIDGKLKRMMVSKLW